MHEADQWIKSARINPMISQLSEYYIYSGKNINDLENPTECNLSIFDWKGKLKENIALDHPLNFITVDQKNKVLYGLNPMN